MRAPSFAEWIIGASVAVVIAGVAFFCWFVQLVFQTALAAAGIGR